MTMMAAASLVRLTILLLAMAPSALAAPAAVGVQASGRGCATAQVRVHSRGRLGLPPSQSQRALVIAFAT